MFDSFLIREDSLKNVEQDGKIVGFKFGVRIADYRGAILSLHNGYYVSVDGVEYPREVQKFEINGKPPRSFEELKNILDRVDNKDYIGVCFDTCHTNDSGYDIVNDFDGVINEFDKIIGLDSLKVFHINGSLNCRGAKKDRHANIGADENNPKGRDCIGFDAINYIVHHKKTQGRPFILETPWISKTENLYKQEIAMLRGDVI